MLQPCYIYFCNNTLVSFIGKILSSICGFTDEICSLTTAFRSVPEPMQCFPLRNPVCFYAVPPYTEDHGQDQFMAFSLTYMSPCAPF